MRPRDTVQTNLDYIFIPGIRDAVTNKDSEIKAYAITSPVNAGSSSEASGSLPEMREFTLRLGDLTDEEREIILKGCLINYNRV